MSDHDDDVETTHPAPVGDDPGTVAGRYRIQHTLGRGGGGHVWLALDEKLGRQVALKRVGGETDAEILVTRGLREARTTATLAHEHVVRVYDAFEFDGAPWIVMEYVPGPSLARLVEDRGRLPVQQVARIGAQVATALAAAHGASIVHRDVKPANVLLTDESGANAKLTDFGIARAEEDHQLTRTGFVAGTAAFFSPELARGEDPTPASDVWALGATLYGAVEGRRPFREEANAVAQLHTIVREQPDPPTHAGALAPALRGMLEPDPARRWTAERAAEELRQVAEGQPVTADTGPWSGSGAAAAGAGAGAAAAAAAVAARRREHETPPPDSTQAVPVVDSTAAIPSVRERTPHAWPGNGNDPRPTQTARPAAPRQAPPRQAPHRARPARRPPRRSMWLGWLLVVPLLVALGWLVWTIADGLEGGTPLGGGRDDGTAASQPAEAEPVSREEAREVADRFYVVVSQQGPEGVADMLGPEAEVDPEIREGLTRLRYEDMSTSPREDGAVVVTATVNYTYGGTTLYRQDEELVVGRTEAGGDPIILQRTTTEPEITEIGDEDG